MANDLCLLWLISIYLCILFRSFSVDRSFDRCKIVNFHQFPICFALFILRNGAHLHECISQRNFRFVSSPPSNGRALPFRRSVYLLFMVFGFDCFISTALPKSCLFAFVVLYVRACIVLEYIFLPEKSEPIINNRSKKTKKSTLNK